MNIEQRLDEWLKQPGTFVTPAELQFVRDMRKAAEHGVGYGWMQQVIQWEWDDYMKRKWGIDPPAPPAGERGRG